MTTTTMMTMTMTTTTMMMMTMMMMRTTMTMMMVMMMMMTTMMHKKDHHYRTEFYRNHHQICPLRQDRVQFYYRTYTVHIPDIHRTYTVHIPYIYRTYTVHTSSHLPKTFQTWRNQQDFFFFSHQALGSMSSRPHSWRRSIPCGWCGSMTSWAYRSSQVTWSSSHQAFCTSTRPTFSPFSCLTSCLAAECCRWATRNCKFFSKIQPAQPESCTCWVVILGLLKYASCAIMCTCVSMHIITYI